MCVYIYIYKFLILVVIILLKLKSSTNIWLHSPRHTANVVGGRTGPPNQTALGGNLDVYENVAGKDGHGDYAEIDDVGADSDYEALQQAGRKTNTATEYEVSEIGGIPVGYLDYDSTVTLVNNCPWT